MKFGALRAINVLELLRIDVNVSKSNIVPQSQIFELVAFDINFL